MKKNHFLYLFSCFFFSLFIMCVSNKDLSISPEVIESENDLFRIEIHYPITAYPEFTTLLKKIVDQGYFAFREEIKKEIFHYLEEEIRFEYLSTYARHIATDQNLLSFQFSFTYAQEGALEEFMRTETRIFRLDNFEEIERTELFRNTTLAFEIISATCYDRLYQIVLPIDRLQLSRTLGENGNKITNYVATNDGLLALIQLYPDNGSEIHKVLIPWTELPSLNL